MSSDTKQPKCDMCGKGPFENLREWVNHRCDRATMSSDTPTYHLEPLPSGNIALMRGIENIAHVCSRKVGLQIVGALELVESTKIASLCSQLEISDPENLSLAVATLLEQLAEARADLLRDHEALGVALAEQLQIADERDALKAEVVRLREAGDILAWIKANVGNIDFHVKVPSTVLSTNPWIATGSTFAGAVLKAKTQLEQALAVRGKGSEQGRGLDIRDLKARITLAEETLKTVHDRLCAFTHEKLTDEQRSEINKIINVIKRNRDNNK